jgi:phage terminase small subunit
MAKGRPPAPGRGASHSSGHRAMAGQGRSPSAVALPVQGTLATLPPPKGLPAAAADTWRAILTDMAALRTLREVDMPLVLAYCEAVYVHGGPAPTSMPTACWSKVLAARFPTP